MVCILPDSADMIYIRIIPVRRSRFEEVQLYESI